MVLLLTNMLHILRLSLDSPYDPSLEHACGIPQNLSTDSFKGKKVVIFGVPGAFTPTCNNSHLPE